MTPPKKFFESQSNSFALPAGFSVPSRQLLVQAVTGALLNIATRYPPPPPARPFLPSSRSKRMAGGGIYLVFLNYSYFSYTNTTNFTIPGNWNFHNI